MKTAMNLIYKDATCAFEDLYQMILHAGEQVNGTRCLYNVGFTIRDVYNPVITTPWRKFSQAYAEREWQWYLSGNRSVAELKRYAPIWDKMHGGDDLVQSNYGWQWMRNGQLDKCIEQLKRDPKTRQAWISIFDGKEKDNYKYDTPCTLAVGFDIETSASSTRVFGGVNITVLMRSNDLVFGFCNDQYCWSKLLKLVADELDRPMGYYYHYAHNLHIYERHYTLYEDYYKHK